MAKCKNQDSRINKDVDISISNLKINLRKSTHAAYYLNKCLEHKQSCGTSLVIGHHRATSTNDEARISLFRQNAPVLPENPFFEDNPFDLRSGENPEILN